MATFISTPAQRGGEKPHVDLRKSHNTPQRNTSPAKSDTTTTRLVALPVPSAGGDNDGTDDSDDGSSDDDESSEDEPDVTALPGAQIACAEHKTDGLAGRALVDVEDYDENDGDDDVMDYTAQTVAGADCQDDDYADVEDVSDGEDSTFGVDEKTIRKLAEKDLIREFQETEEDRGNASLIFQGLTEIGMGDDRANARRLNIIGNNRSLAESDDLFIDLDEDPFAGVPTHETLYSDMLQDAELAIWRMPHGERKEMDSSSTAQKRVRFEEARSQASSDSDSDDENDNDFPDLFAHEDDPLLKQRLALVTSQDADMMTNDLHDADSVFDFDGEEEQQAFELDEFSSSDEDESSSDSEDDGDTTDEETAEEQLARMHEMKRTLGGVAGAPSTPAAAKKKVLLKASRTPMSSRPASVSKGGRGPVAGTFRLDPGRASMTANADGTEIQVRPPITPSEKEKGFWERARTASMSRHGSPLNPSYYTIASPVNNNSNTGVPSRPLTARSTLGSLFDGKLDMIRSDQVSGLHDDRFPAPMPYLDTSFVARTATEASEDDEPDIDMADFIDMDFSESETEDDPPTAQMSSPQQDADVFSSFQSDNEPPAKPGRQLLEHLSQSRNIIGSFRINQTHARHVSSLASHPAQRASASEYNALQKGRRAAGNSPMTPARKSRGSLDLSNTNNSGVKKNVGSPLSTRRPRSRGNSIGGALNLAGLRETISSPLK